MTKTCLSFVTPAPLEHLSVTAETLSGQQGRNRAPSFITCQIAANNDLEAIQTWLAEFTASPQTQRNYRKEAERLLLWSLIEKQKPLSSLNRDDLRDYQAFLQQPRPQARWCGPRRLRTHPDWKPFQGSLQASSIAQAITSINALFSYLVEAGYLAGNPLGLMRHKLNFHADQKAAVTERFLEQGLWQRVVHYVETLPATTPREVKIYERTRYLLHLLYLLGPRVSEVARQSMQSIHCLRGKWWWQVTGKGRKTHQIPVSDTMLKAFMRYRQFYGLSQLPQSGEDKPLFLSINGTKGVTSNMIYRLLKQLFSDCADTLETERPDWASTLRAASTHWVRHTTITHQTDAGIELRYIKRNARHESVETTMLYQHAEEEKWHDAMSDFNLQNTQL